MLTVIEVCAIRTSVGVVAGYTVNTSDERGVITRLSGSMFYGNTILSLLLSWRLLSSWKNDLSRCWLKIETQSGLDLQPDGNIRKRVVILACVVACCAGAEHTLSMISSTGLDCPASQYFMKYILKSHGFVLQPQHYSLWVAIPIFITSKIATIQWNFQDLIVIVISMGLSSRYRRLNLLVKRIVADDQRTKDYKDSSKLWLKIYTWRKLRQAYATQANLVRRVDKELGALILLCNLNNFFFICLQLFLGLRKSEGAFLNRIYHFVSLGWLMLRSCSVVLAAAEVNYQSQRALPNICGCPGYNIEVKRLKYQLMNDEVSLSGMRLFLLNRPRLLKVVAAIIKYELILLQYDE